MEQQSGMRKSWQEEQESRQFPVRMQSYRKNVIPSFILAVCIYHLRGGIDYGRLSIMHKTMMKRLYTKAKNLPEEKKTAEVRAMLDTYGKQVDFVDFSKLDPIERSLSCHNR